MGGNKTGICSFLYGPEAFDFQGGATILVWLKLLHHFENDDWEEWTHLQVHLSKSYLELPWNLVLCLLVGHNLHDANSYVHLLHATSHYFPNVIQVQLWIRFQQHPLEVPERNNRRALRPNQRQGATQDLPRRDHLQRNHCARVPTSVFQLHYPLVLLCWIFSPKFCAFVLQEVSWTMIFN